MGKAAPLRDLSTLSICLGLVLIIVAVDWMMPAGIVVGMLLAVPLLLASSSKRPSDVWIVLAAAMAGKVAAAIFGAAPISPAAVWVPNRILSIAVLPAAAMLAMSIQQRRLELEQSLESAVAAGDTNRLLFSLLAHDLRSPLVLSRQMLDYIDQCIAEESTPDRALLQEVRLRLERNLRVIDGVLTTARGEIEQSADQEPEESGVTDLHDQIALEVASFGAEAAMRRKQITTSLQPLDRAVAAVDALVLRQVLGILLDNAIRYADPGTIHVEMRLLDDGVLQLRVNDPGSRSARHVRTETEAGAGLGLQLCSLLLSRAGGGLRIIGQDDEATAVEALLPLGHASTA